MCIITLYGPFVSGQLETTAGGIPCLTQLFCPPVAYCLDYEYALAAYYCIAIFFENLCGTIPIDISARKSINWNCLGIEAKSSLERWALSSLVMSRVIDNY